MLFVFAINEQRIKPKQKKVMKKFIALVALVLVSASTMMYAQESNAFTVPASFFSIVFSKEAL